MRSIASIVWFTLLLCALIAPKSAQAQTSRVFVTSTDHPADFTMFDPGGLAVADIECAFLATRGGLDPSGRWVAWISTSTVNAKDRLTPGSGPFVNTKRPTSEMIANDIADLTDGTLDSMILYDESGAAPAAGFPSRHPWTGTRADGMLSLNRTCDNWTDIFGPSGLTGHTSTKDSRWTENELSSCIARRPFYCFEAPPSTRPGPPVLMATVDDDDVTLNWTASKDALWQSERAPAASYLLRYGFSPGVLPARVPLPNVLTFTRNDVPAGTYYAVVHGEDAAGQPGPASNEVEIVVGTPMLPGPTTLFATVNGNRVTYSWTPSKNATAYGFKFGTASGQYGNPTLLPDQLAISGTLVPGFSVYAVVHGVNSFGPGPDSNEVRVTAEP